MNKQLDLGGGSVMRARDGYECYGADVTNPHQDPRIKVVDLAIDDLPYPDNEFDLVTAYDVLEHIPAIVYISDPSGTKRRQCMIELFNEIYRVLKPGGEFYMQTPAYHPEQPDLGAVWSDPTHCYVWTPNTVNHFSGDYVGMHDHYGHTSDFAKVEQHYQNGHIYLTLRATKPMRKEFTL